MKLTYVVNMNNPGYLPSYDGNEHDTLKEAATTALDIVDTLTSQRFTPDAAALDMLIDLENERKVWASFEAINVEMIGDHETFIVFIQPLLTPEVC